MRILSLIAVLTLGLSVAAVAGPQEGSDGAEGLPAFQKADGNGDGQLTWQEVKELNVSKKTFKEEDLDNDGKLSKYDYKYGVK